MPKRSVLRGAVFAALIVLLLAPAARSGDGDRGATVHSERPRFIVNTPARLGLGGEPELVVEFVVPFTELLFVKGAEALFRARFELVVILYDADGDQIGGDLWTHEVTVSSFAATVDPARSFASATPFRVQGGRLRAKVSMRDLDSGLEGEIQRKVDVPAFDRLPFSMSDLSFIPCAPPDSTGADSLSAMHVRGRFGGDPLPPICVRGELYDPRHRAGAGPVDYRLEWRVRDERGDERASGTERVTADAPRVPFTIRPAFEPLSLGRYDLRVEVHAGGGAFERRISFEMDETRLSLLADFGDLLDMVGYIGSSSEVAALEDAPPPEREKEWAEFWQRRDPSPGTPENEAKEEFFRRIQFTNAVFGSPGTPGWRSDRGMVYIRYGPPDQIESRPMNPSDPPHEIWHYYAQNRVYVFADLNGFGHYVLVRTERESGR